MLPTSHALDRLTTLVDRVRRAGADAADAIYIADAAIQANVRLEKLEEVNQSEEACVSLRVFFGLRAASKSTSDFSPKALDVLVDRVAAMARAAPPDRYAGLAPEDMVLKGVLPDLDLYDPSPIDADLLLSEALAAEEAGRRVRGVVNTGGASARADKTMIALATSHGIAHGYCATSHSISAAMVAGGEAGMAQDYDYAVARHRCDLPSAEAVGRRAGEWTVKRASPVKIASGSMPVVFDPRVASQLVGHLIRAINGSAVARKSTFLLAACGKQIFAPGVTIREEPWRKRGLRSRPCDAEGVPTKNLDIVSDGVLTTWLMDAASARQLRARPTGHAARGVSGPPGTNVSNLMLMPGKTSRADMLGAIRRGLYVTELIGSGVNGVTGDYSRGAAGFLIENGELTRPVAEVAIAGNLKELFATLVPADDLELRYGIDAPSVLIPRMMVSGT